MDLDSWCSPRMAGFKKPRRVELVDTLPRNAMGKIDKALLRIRLAEQTVERSS